MDFQHTVSVPTKQSEDSGGGGLNRMLGLRGSRGDVPRQRSSSNSFDVAASLFSSMQNLEASGRSLSSLLLGGSASSGPLMPLGPQLNLGDHGGFPLGGVAGTGQNNNLRLPPRNLMQLIPTAQLGGSLQHQNLGMGDLRQQQQQVEGNPFQAPPRLDTMRRGYYPFMDDATDVNDLTTQELFNELTRRRSERSRAPGVIDAKSAMFSAELFPNTRLINGVKSHQLRNSSRANVDLANQYQMQSGNPPRRGSEDSLDLLAATANINAVREKVAVDKQRTSSTQSDGADIVAVTTIPTRFKPSRKSAKKKRKSESVLSDVSVLSDDEASNSKRKKAKRNGSSSSLDVLLTALGDDLENLDKLEEKKELVPSILQRENKDELLLRRLSKDSIFSCISDDQPLAYDMICQPIMQENLTRKKEKPNLASLFGSRPSSSMPSKESGAPLLYPAHGLNLDYARRLQTSNSMMASLESEMMRNDLALRQIAFREMQRQQFASRMVQNNLQSNKDSLSPADSKPEQQLPLPGKSTSSGSRKVSCDTPSEAKEEKNEPNTPSIDATGSPLRWNRKNMKPVRIPPKEALKIFLSTHGKKGEALREAMLKAISETEGSLADIHSWDRSQGLRKCHNRTVVKTRRSRAQLKAFLTGVEPPKEPHLNRKRQKKSKSKKMDDVFGPPKRTPIP